jgi:hypothetical protein
MRRTSGLRLGAGGEDGRGRFRGRLRGVNAPTVTVVVLSGAGLIGVGSGFLAAEGRV